MPPPVLLLKLNSLVRQEPWATLSYGICWMIVLGIIAPTVAVFVLIPFTIYRLLAWQFDWIGSHEYDPTSPPKNKNNNNNNKKQLAIVVTGCDSGFGKDIALKASKAGFVVFAGCLNPESIEYYKKNTDNSTTIIPILMNVTKDDDVTNVAKIVSKWLEEGEGEGEKTSGQQQHQQRVLHALINNAGISITGYFDWLDITDIQKVMDVNYFGPIRCCKAFLPILKRQSLNDIHDGNRIINLTSVVSLVPGGPLGWNYGSSKHAVQTFTEGLRKELAVFGIGVTSINPGFTKTPILESHTNQMDNQWNKMKPEIKEEYGRECYDSVMTFVTNLNHTFALPMGDVTSSVLDVLQIRNPPGQVLCGVDAKCLWSPHRLLPSWFHERVLVAWDKPAAVLKKEKAYNNNNKNNNKEGGDSKKKD